MEFVPNEVRGAADAGGGAADAGGRAARWARRATPILAAGDIVLVAACSGSTIDQAPTTADAATATPLASATPQATEPSGTTAVDYFTLFNRVSASTVESVGVLNGFALFINTNDEARGDLSTDVRLLIGSIEFQLAVLEEAEPVRPDLTEAHESLKTALGRYIEAATLLLPSTRADQTVSTSSRSSRWSKKVARAFTAPVRHSHERRPQEPARQIALTSRHPCSET